MKLLNTKCVHNQFEKSLDDLQLNKYLKEGVICSGHIVAGRTGKDGHFLETLGAGASSPQKTSPKTTLGPKYKSFSVDPHMSWEKLTNPRINRSI